MTLAQIVTLALFAFAHALAAFGGEISPPPLLRCAFDIGSGETKVVLAPVTTSPGTLKVIWRDFAKVPIKRTVVNGEMPEETVRALTDQLKVYREECEKRGAKDFVGVATSGFRAATQNGAEALAKVSAAARIPLRIVSGDEEAAIGYASVEASLPAIAGQKLVVWDIGGGSMQFSARKAPGTEPVTATNLWVTSLNLGASSFQDELTAAFGRAAGQPLSPISDLELARAVPLARKHVTGIPAPLRQALADRRTLVIGVGGSHWEGLARALGPDLLYTREEAIGLRKLLVGHDIPWIKARYPELGYAEYKQSNAILVSTFMERLGIRKIQALEVNLADGLFR